MNPPGLDVASWVQQRLEMLLAAPRMWGSFEAVELQALTLFQLKAALVNPARERDNPRRVLDQYVHYLRERSPHHRGAPLHQVLGEEQESEFVRALAAFDEWLQPSLIPENPFEHSELALDLRFAENVPSATSFTSYYEAFRKATRGVIRTGNTGRPTKAIEQATDFALERATVRRKNGVDASVLLQLGRAGQVDVLADEQVRDALTKLVTIAEWAESGASVAELGIDDLETRTRTAVQALRVVPQRDIKSVRIGGRLIGRQKPAIIRPLHQTRLVEVASAGSKREPFDQTDEVRAIDLDRGLLRLGKKPGVDCYVRLDQAELVWIGTRVRVKGEQLRPRGARKPFVIVDTLEYVADSDDSDEPAQ